MSRYFEDISDQQAEANDAALNELYADRDDWPDDERPTRAELDADERDSGWDYERERWRAHADEH